MTKMITLEINTAAHSQMKDITAEVKRAVADTGVRNGICVLFVPHTTGAVTINENADPDVVRDFLYEIDKVVPWNDGYRHYEGNSAAHLKASMIGFSETILIEDGKLVLGTWQGIYFTEFDGPRRRKLHIKVLESQGLFDRGRLEDRR